MTLHLILSMIERFSRGHRSLRANFTWDARSKFGSFKRKFLFTNFLVREGFGLCKAVLFFQSLCVCSRSYLLELPVNDLFGSFLQSTPGLPMESHKSENPQFSFFQVPLLRVEDVLVWASKTSRLSKHIQIISLSGTRLWGHDSFNSFFGYIHFQKLF